MNETFSKEKLKHDSFNEIGKKNPNRIIIAYLNTSSRRNKFEKLKEVTGTEIDILLISETKLDNIFLLSQFVLEGFTPPYNLDRTEHGWRPNAFHLGGNVFQTVTQCKSFW